MASVQPLPEPIALPSPPNDGITSIQYLPSSSSSSSVSSIPSSSLLVSTSWDGALRIHDTGNEKSHLVTQTLDCGPLLCMTIPPTPTLPSSSDGDDGDCDDAVKGIIYTGGGDGTIKSFDIVTSTVSTIGQHKHNSAASSSEDDDGDNKKRKGAAAVSCLNYINSDYLASAGWDAKFHIWNVQQQNVSSNSSGGGKPVVTIDLPGKAFSMDISTDGTKAVVATSGRRNCFIDISIPESTSSSGGGGGGDIITAKLLLDRESSLKYQTRCIKFLYPEMNGIAVGSIEGRVAVEYLDDIGIPSGKKKYAFKCHRINDTIYPVNTIAFHPTHGTFATGGADGTVVTWDGANKKKLCSIAKCPTSVACLAFNADGGQIAIASSYTFEEGERDHPREEIYVRDVLDSEVRPKMKK